MIQRLYIHNFRCLDNFELIIKDLSSALLIGKNGVGKSSIAAVLQILQKISRGVNRMRDLEALDLLSVADFTQARTKIPMRFELHVQIDDKAYHYVLVVELPEQFKELRVAEESLHCETRPIYTRKSGRVTLHADTQEPPVQFDVDWHLVALPIIQEKSNVDPLFLFKNWLAHAIILDPIPSLMSGESDGETLEPNRDGSNFGKWFSGLLSRYPAAYTRIEKYLRDVLPDIQDFLNEPIGKDAKNMVIRFGTNHTTTRIDFDDLSDGEKCYFLCAVVIAANKFYGPLFCFWDEPDNYLSLSEIGHFILELRREFQGKSQIIITSHNPEAIRKFSNKNTFFLDRKSHLEPTLIKLLEDMPIKGDLVDALIRGDLEL